MAPPDHCSQMGGPQECFPLRPEPPTNIQKEWSPGAQRTATYCVPSHTLGAGGEGGSSASASGHRTWVGGDSPEPQKLVGQRGQHILAAWKAALLHWKATVLCFPIFLVCFLWTGRLRLLPGGSPVPMCLGHCLKRVGRSACSPADHPFWLGCCSSTLKSSRVLSPSWRHRPTKAKPDPWKPHSCSAGWPPTGPGHVTRACRAHQRRPVCRAQVHLLLLILELPSGLLCRCGALSNPSSCRGSSRLHLPGRVF